MKSLLRTRFAGMLSTAIFGIATFGAATLAPIDTAEASSCWNHRATSPANAHRNFNHGARHAHRAVNTALAVGVGLSVLNMAIQAQRQQAAREARQPRRPQATHARRPQTRPSHAQPQQASKPRDIYADGPTRERKPNTTTTNAPVPTPQPRPSPSGGSTALDWVKNEVPVAPDQPDFTHAKDDCVKMMDRIQRGWDMIDEMWKRAERHSDGNLSDWQRANLEQRTNDIREIQQELLKEVLSCDQPEPHPKEKTFIESTDLETGERTRIER